MKGVDPLGTLPMFEVPEPPAKFRPAVTTTPGRPRWSKYRPKNPVKCDDCLAVLVELRGDGPATSQAKFKRTVGTEHRLLCYAHAQQWRDRDGMPKLKGGPK